VRVAISEHGYSATVEELVVANQTAAHVVATLADALRGTGGMAGDDHTATEFAASYDEAAAASLDALESLVGAFGSLARLTEASLTNHAVADADATLPAWARAVAGPPSAADGAVGVLVGTPPSSLGSDTAGPGGMVGVVLDHLEDVFWPNADPDRLRAAGAAWHQAAGSFDVLVADCDRAASHLAHERSPEVPLALASLDQLRAHLADLGAQLSSLGDACTDYAAHVDAKRAELRELLEDLALELGIMAGLGIIGSFLSGGAAAGLASGAGAARLASAGAKARGILDSLRILASTPALRLRPVAVTAGEVTIYTKRVASARVMAMESARAGARSPRFPSGSLLRHEDRVAHTLRDHVGRTLEQMRARLIEKPGLSATSTFRTSHEAERAIEEVLRRNAQSVDRWLAAGRGKHVLTEDLGREVGTILARGNQSVVPATKARVVLIPDETMPEGWRLLTAYPC
jgi:CDI toxin RNase A-like protein